MKAKMRTKVTAVFLAVVILLVMIPFSAFPVAAESITDINELGSLGKGFNMLGNQQLTNTSLSGYEIFKSTQNMSIQKISGSFSSSEFTYINDMHTFLNEQSASASIGLDASAKFKLFSLEAQFKYGISASSSSETAQEYEYAILEHYASRLKKTLDLTKDSFIERLWAKNGDGTYVTFNDDFVDSLLNDDPEFFFNKYGTHIITQYAAGGEMYVVYKGVDLGSRVTSSSSWDSNITVGADIEMLGGIKTDIAASGEVKDAESATRSDISMKSEVLGGSGVRPSAEELLSGGTATSNAWSESMSSDKEDNLEILSDNNLQFLSIWSLLVDEKYADRRAELEQYFNENISEDFAEFYGKYVYTPADSVNFSGYTFIRSASDFNDIRNDLDGKYVLLNNIDLSDYEEWTPIGTAAEPFTGTFNGNGNTISGLHITMCDTYAGLFGYNGSNGTIKNLTVSGNIDANASGSANNIAYVGGIVGYNKGTVENCVNLVNVNGEMNITDGESVILQEPTWFDDHAASIENAKKVTTSNTYTVGTTPLKLTGTHNAAVTVSGTSAQGVAYIVLENANITGTITNNGSNRDICIISIGSSNTITGSTDTIAVNAPNANVYLCGDAPLTITGGSGANGSGYQENGTTGNNGSAGKTGIVCKTLNISVNNTLTVTGGTGGIGAQGKKGADGAYGPSTSDICNDTTPHSTKQGSGTNGSSGGTGGNGGIGGIPISNGIAVNVYNGIVYFTYGSGGTGGIGGTGGTGGTGRTGANAYKGVVWLGGAGYSFGYDGGNGGNGGIGGKGGNGGSPAEYAKINATVTGSANVFCLPGQQGPGGKGGTGGSGGAGGAGGSCDGTATDVSGPCGFYRCTCGGHGGNGGMGGKGGDGGAGSVAGSGGDSGNGGAGGIHIRSLNDLKNCWCCYDGTPGGKGAPGGDGERTVVNNICATLTTSTSEYTLYTEAKTWESAKGTIPTDEKLVSIGSAEEEALIEKLISTATPGQNEYWIGLQTVDYSNGLFAWEDGSYIKIVGTGSQAKAYRINKDTGEIWGDAYVNFDSGEPNNQGAEMYMHFNPLLLWNDVNDSKIFGYITEKTRTTFEENAHNLDKNALFVGGICGYNIGTVKQIKNSGEISVNKVHSANSGASAYAAGIAGYNGYLIENAWSTASISALTISDSYFEYAVAVCSAIANGKEYGTCYIDQVSQKANAVSVNNLSHQIPVSAESITQGDSQVAVHINDYWDNSKLEIIHVADRNNMGDLVVEDPFGSGSVGRPGTGFGGGVLLSLSAMDPSATKSNYIVGEEFDRGSVVLNYNGQEVSDYTVQYNFLQPGTTTVTAVYKTINDEGEIVRYSRYIPVTVGETLPTSLEVYSAKTEFIIGDRFEESGLTLKLNYDNGSYDILSSKDYVIETAPNMALIGTQSVTVYYTVNALTVLSCTYEINISPVTMVGMQITKHPDKMTYWRGDALDVTGIQIQKIMNNGSIEELSIRDPGMNIDYDFSVAGTQTVTLTYGEFSNTFECTVKELEVVSIKILELPSKTNYVENDALQPDGIKIQKVMSNGSTEYAYSSDEKLSYIYDFSSVGTKKVTVRYGSCTDTFDCTVYSYDEYLKTAPTIMIDHTTASAGNNVGVTVSVKNNPGILNATITITYDPELTLIAAEAGEALTALDMTQPGTFSSPCNFLWDAIEMADDTNGSILKLTFALPDNAEVGKTYAIEVSYVEGDIAGSDLKPIQFETSPGSITVVDCTPGDINNDGRINGTDVTLLRRYIAGGYGIEIMLGAADVNNDGRINGTDVTLLRRYIAGGYGVELK